MSRRGLFLALTFVPARVSSRRTTSVLVGLMLAVSVVAATLPFVLPARATLSFAQTTSSTCSLCTSISLVFPDAVQSGDALVVMVCWSGEVTGESFSDSSAINAYQQVVSSSNTVECAGAWARAAETGTITETVSWSGSVDAIVNIYEAYGPPATINVLRNSGSGNGTSLSLPVTTNGPDSFDVSCYATASPVTLTAEAPFTLDGTSATGGCEHGTNPSASTTFPMTSSANVTWAGIGLAVVQQRVGVTQCAGSANTQFSCLTDNATNQVGIGDMLVVSATRTDAGGTWTISDSQGNVWTSVGSVSNTVKAQVWYAVAKSYGYDNVTVNFADLSSQSVMVNIMDCGTECTNQSITYSTGTGTGTSFGVASQTMAIGVGFAIIATSANPGTITGGSGYASWLPSAAGAFESREFNSRSSNTCPEWGTKTVTWAEICVSFRVGIVETLNLVNGPNTSGIAPSNHFTVSYAFDGISRTLSIGDAKRTWVDDQFDTVSLSATTSGSTSTHEWVTRLLGGVAFPQTWSSGNTVRAVSEEYTYYELYKNTLRITSISPSTWDASRTIKIDGVQMGNYTQLVTFTPPNGAGAQSASIWMDKGHYVIWEPSTGGASDQSWVPNPIESSVISSGGKTYNSNYTRLSTGVTTTITTTATSISTTTATFSTVLTTNTTTVTQTQTVTSGTTQTVTSATTATQTTTVAGGTTETQTVVIGPTQTKTVISATTQTVTGGATHTQTVTSATTQTVTSATTQTVTSATTQTVTSATTRTVAGGTTQTQTQTVTSAATQTITSGTTHTQTVTSAITAMQTQTATSTATVTSTKTTTSVTTQTNNNYLWILVLLPVVVFLLALYILRSRERAQQ